MLNSNVANLIKETIKVTAVGQFGPKVGNVWYSLNEPLTPADFIAGQTYEVLVRVSGPSQKNPMGGKKYISQIVSQSEETIAPKITSTTDTTYVGAKNVTFKQRDYDAEARGKSKFGLYAAALQSPALAGLQFNGIEELFVLVRKAADDGMAYVFEDKQTEIEN